MSMLYQRMDALNNHLIRLEADLVKLRTDLSKLCVAQQVSEGNMARAINASNTDLANRISSVESRLPTIDSQRLEEVENVVENLDGDVVGLKERLEKWKQETKRSLYMHMYGGAVSPEVLREELNLLGGHLKHRVSVLEELVSRPKLVKDLVESAPVSLSTKVPTGAGRKVTDEDLPKIPKGLILYYKCALSESTDPAWNYSMVVTDDSVGLVYLVDKSGLICATTRGKPNRDILKYYHFALDRGPFGSAGHLWSEVNPE